MIKYSGQMDAIGKASGFVNKAFKWINYPHAKYKEAKKKHDDFKGSTLKPLVRELEGWQGIMGKLEDIVVEDNDAAKSKYLGEIKGYAKDINDPYRKNLLKKVDKFETSGPDKKGVESLCDDITEIISHYRGEVSRMNKEKAPSKAKLYGWGGATVGTYGTIAYIFLKRKFKK